MINVLIADATLRKYNAVETTLKFNEKTDIVKRLDKLNVDAIETPFFTGDKADVLFLHTVATMTTNAVISCPVTPDVKLVATACEALAKAKKARVQILLPVSPIQLEYQSHKKPKVMLELLGTCLEKAGEYANIEVEVSMLDANHAEVDFLLDATKLSIAKGAKVINLCNTEGDFLGAETLNQILEYRKSVPELDGITLSLECSNIHYLAPTCALMCLTVGVTQIKTAFGTRECMPLNIFADLLQLKQKQFNLNTHLNTAITEQSADAINAYLSGKPVVPTKTTKEMTAQTFTKEDSVKTISEAIGKMGYELSSEDLLNVYKEFQRIASKKVVYEIDLESIVASIALQAPSTYKLKSFVITSGNLITSMAHVILEKGDTDIQGYSTGAGPIDAAFLAIDSIIGRHFELDDFHINALTEGREAVGSGIVRLRANGKLYSGQGVSTDIIGAAIRAYLNAVNKICFDEKVNE